MGRQVRMVPPGFEHPKDDKGRFIPLMNGPFSERLAEWREEKRQWDDGFVRDYANDGWKSREPDHGASFDEWNGEEPKADHYMPEFAEGTATHLMMYEDTSEGTPISPAFATPEELAHWLADNGASAFGRMTATYEQWLATCRAGWAPSAVFSFAGGLQSGVASMTDEEKN